MQADAGALNNLGGDLYTKGDLLGARLHYEAALKLEPNLLAALANMAIVLGAEGKLQVAEACLRKVVACSPKSGDQWNNYGNILMRLFKYQEAEVAFNNAAELCPDNPGTWHNLALLMSRLGRYDEALMYIERAEALGSDSLGLKNDKGLTLLYKGDALTQALEVYEARWETIPHSEAWDFHIPEWKGESLQGKRVLFHQEQGYGDTIMTLRFVNALQERGAEVVVGVFPGLARLVEQQGWEVIDLFKFNAKSAKTFNYHSPMFSAIRWLGIERSEINPMPYLKAPEIITPPVFEGAFNVGICWTSGKRGGDLDWRRRIAPLEHWLQLASVSGVVLHSLQVGQDAQDIETLGANVLINDPTRSFSDWADTAAFIAKLDLVISVDTAVAHLSAAMGKPTWMLSQHMHCWRWWDLARGTGKPWYNSMRILKQDTNDDWLSLLNQCREWLIFEVDQKLKVAA